MKNPYAALTESESCRFHLCRRLNKKNVAGIKEKFEKCRYHTPLSYTGLRNRMQKTLRKFNEHADLIEVRIRGERDGRILTSKHSPWFVGALPPNEEVIGIKAFNELLTRFLHSFMASFSYMVRQCLSNDGANASLLLHMRLWRDNVEGIKANSERIIRITSESGRAMYHEGWVATHLVTWGPTPSQSSYQPPNLRVPLKVLNDADVDNKKLDEYGFGLLRVAISPGATQQLVSERLRFYGDEEKGEFRRHFYHSETWPFGNVISCYYMFRAIDSMINLLGDSSELVADRSPVGWSP